jgi:membrane protein DedA with SNARE-associated domain
MNEHKRPSFWRWLKKHEDWFILFLGFAVAGLIISSVVWTAGQVLEKLKDNFLIELSLIVLIVLLGIIALLYVVYRIDVRAGYT